VLFVRYIMSFKISFQLLPLMKNKLNTELFYFIITVDLTCCGINSCIFIFDVLKIVTVKNENVSEM
jgi:hypothetical protein